MKSNKQLEDMDIVPYSSPVPVDFVFNQLDSGQCGGCSGSMLLHEHEYIKGNDVYPSHTYIYGMDNERFADGMYFDVLTKRLLLGVCSEIKEDKEMLSKEDARRLCRYNDYDPVYKCKEYKYLYTWKQVINAIRLYNGVIISVNVYDNWKAAPEGHIGKKKGNILGRHLVFCKDYKIEDGTYYIRFVNSWGEDWGDNGCGYLNTKSHSFFNAVAFSQCD